jgi:hypothetical protein
MVAPDAGIHEDQVRRRFDQQTVETHLNAIILVGFRKSGPEDLGDDAKHGPTVQFEMAIAYDVKFEITELHKS